MKTNYNILLLLLLGLSSCSDFLQRDPEDFGAEPAYFNKEADLRDFVNSFYTLFPTNVAYGNNIYTLDNISDNQTSFGSNTLFVPDKKQIPEMDDNSEYRYKTVRNCNYFIDLITRRMAAGTITGSSANINHYLGEAYFFRAYTYYRKLRTYGDLPVIETVMPDDFNKLVQLSKRTPQNEVARFIIKDLVTAAQMMLPAAPAQGRLSQDAAFLLLARVALYEGTWLKYHGGTGLAPGNPKWPGNRFFPNYQFPAGSIEKEIEYFFDQAIEASDKAASKRPLYQKGYAALFNSNSLAGIPEIILAKDYIPEKNGHSVSQGLARQANGTGYTRSLVDSYLMDDGLPYYKSDRYLNDTSLINVMTNRDHRLVVSTNITGDINDIDKAKNDTTFIGLPRINGRSYTSNTPTGYEIGKWRSLDRNQTLTVDAGHTSSPIFRSAEAYCIYLEAYYERHGNLGGNCDTYWRQLRKRAGVDEDYNKTIAATNLDKEIDLARYSGKIMVNATLYNIRRERRSEFIAEGMRLEDLRRWRSLDMMVNYQVQGLNLWEQYYRNWDYIDKKGKPQNYLFGKPKTISQPDGTPEGNYIYPYKVDIKDAGYYGLNFPRAHYLEPIPISEFVLTGSNDPDASTMHQNPGWSNSSSTYAISNEEFETLYGDGK